MDFGIFFSFDFSSSPTPLKTCQQQVRSHCETILFAGLHHSNCASFPENCFRWRQSVLILWCWTLMNANFFSKFPVFIASSISSFCSPNFGPFLIFKICNSRTHSFYFPIRFLTTGPCVCWVFTRHLPYPCHRPRFNQLSWCCLLCEFPPFPLYFILIYIKLQWYFSRRFTGLN